MPPPLSERCFVSYSVSQGGVTVFNPSDCLGCDLAVRNVTHLQQKVTDQLDGGVNGMFIKVGCRIGPGDVTMDTGARVVLAYGNEENWGLSPDHIDFSKCGYYSDFTD